MEIKTFEFGAGQLKLKSQQNKMGESKNKYHNKGSLKDIKF